MWVFPCVVLMEKGGEHRVCPEEYRNPVVDCSVENPYERQEEAPEYHMRALGRIDCKMCDLLWDSKLGHPPETKL